MQKLTKCYYNGISFHFFVSLEQLQTGKPIFIALKNKMNGVFVEDVQKRTKNVIGTLAVATVKISYLKSHKTGVGEGAPTAPMVFVLLVSTIYSALQKYSPF